MPLFWGGGFRPAESETTSAHHETYIRPCSKQMSTYIPLCPCPSLFGREALVQACRVLLFLPLKTTTFRNFWGSHGRKVSVTDENLPQVAQGVSRGAGRGARAARTARGPRNQLHRAGRAVPRPAAPQQLEEEAAPVGQGEADVQCPAPRAGAPFPKNGELSRNQETSGSCGELPYRPTLVSGKLEIGRGGGFQWRMPRTESPPYFNHWSWQVSGFCFCYFGFGSIL